jgi:hypothetical protein
MLKYRNSHAGRPVYNESVSKIKKQELNIPIEVIDYTFWNRAETGVLSPAEISIPNCPAAK